MNAKYIHYRNKYANLKYFTILDIYTDANIISNIVFNIAKKFKVISNKQLKDIFKYDITDIKTELNKIDNLINCIIYYDYNIETNKYKLYCMAEYKCYFIEFVFNK